MDNILTLLQSCMSLQDFQLYVIEPEPLGLDVTSYPEPTRRVALPGLQKLDLTFQRGPDHAHFLAHLDLSPQTQVKLSKYSMEPDANALHVSGVAYSLPRDRSSFAYLEGVESIWVHQGHRGFSRIVAYRRGGDDDGDVDIEVCNKDPARAVRNILRKLAFLFEGRGTVTTVTFACHLAVLHQATVEDWQEALAPFTSVTRIKFYQEKAYNRPGDSPEDDVEQIRRFLQALAPSERRLLPHLKGFYFRSFEDALLDAINEDVNRCIFSRGAIFSVDSDSDSD